MPTFICLANWTQKGIEDVKSSPSRLDAAKTTFREMGCEFKGFYMTAGRYDLVFVVEAKDEASIARRCWLRPRRVEYGLKRFSPSRRTNTARSSAR